MRLLVTRPAVQAAEWVARLRDQGFEAQALPLIGIDDAPDGQALAQAWVRLADHRLVVFVSPNAVERFFASRPAQGVWPAGTLAGSPGPGTTRALLRAGVPSPCIVEPAADAAQFDSESLWLQLARHEWSGARVLIVRGDGGREWLADTLRGHGAEVSALCAYRRAAPAFDPVQRAIFEAALARPAAHGWLFSSSEAIDHLEAAAPGANWRDARAIATHPRIAERARALGMGQVHECRPAFEAVVACIQSFASARPA